MTLVTFSLVCGQLKSRSRKKSNEPFLRKSDFNFFPYLTMARNRSKITKESMWKSASIEKWHFSFPYPPYFFDWYSHFTGKRKKLISYMLVRKFPFSRGNDCTYQKSKDIFFLKGGMGKRSYYCHLSIEALFHILSIVILIQFPTIGR